MENVSRKILVVSTSGRGTIEIQSKATNWGELQNDFRRENISWNGMKVVTGTKVTLEHASGELPSGDFEVYLMPVKSKSGASRTEILFAAKTILDKNPGLKAEIGNITQKKSDILEAFISKYSNGETVISPTAPIETAKAKSEKEIAPVVETKTEEIETAKVQPVVAFNESTRIFVISNLETVLGLLEKVYDDHEDFDDMYDIVKDNIKFSLKFLKELSSGIAPQVSETKSEETKEQKDERERRERRERNTAAQQRMRDMASGFSDVRI